MRIAWTGHRPDLFRDPAAARRRVDALARRLRRQAADVSFLSGGQRGVDTWAARAAIALGVPFVLVLPLEADRFAADWAPADAEALAELIRRARHVHVVGGEPERAYTERNRLLAVGADRLVAVWTGLGGGGTAETIGFARAAGVPVREVVLPPSPTASSAQGRGL
jgi:predicted Rossmann fold nucleotide-binding protein DprA/Smf involved in DNA uptake